ncbi:MAG: hypothetical protein OSA47_00285 [Novosphingopyxis baekryungensis]|mgnify:CR=1 FL=1|jgi:hypothetical protein|nr:hypothetical protein [Novosphingopyxis baekryungensis]
MIEVRAHLEIKADSQSGWQLVFWVSDGFNYSTPFRAMLVDIAEALGKDAAGFLSLPAYSADEDFVEGTLRFDDASLAVYYEYALGYLTLANENREILADAAERIQRRIALL